MALWALSTTGGRFQGTRALMVLSVLPDECVSRYSKWVAMTLFTWRGRRRPRETFGTFAGREGTKKESLIEAETVVAVEVVAVAWEASRPYGKQKL